MPMQATVGAGLPIISTLQTLLETGDNVQQIEGVFSGTLSYIFNRSRHRPSSLLRMLHALQVQVIPAVDKSSSGPI